MKHGLIIIFHLAIVNICFGQISKKKVPIFVPVCEVSKLEYVSFCGVKFKVPREKTSIPKYNCCQGDSSYNSNSLRCDNGGLLTWTYYPTIEIAKSTVDKDIKLLYLNKGVFEIEKEPIICYLLDKKINGYRLKLRLKAVTSQGSGKQFKTTMIQHLIIVSAVVRGQPVLIELMHSKLNNNNDIVKPIRQIIHF